MTDDHKDTEEVFYYSVKNAPRFKIKLCGERLVAEEGVLKLTSEQNDELESLMVKRLDLKQTLVKLDFERAENIARLHRDHTLPMANRSASGQLNVGEAQIRAERLKTDPSFLSLEPEEQHKVMADALGIPVEEYKAQISGEPPANPASNDPKTPPEPTQKEVPFPFAKKS